MPLSPDIARLIPAWKARKKAQWERIAGAVPGLQLVVKGDQYTLACHRDEDGDGKPEFYEAIVIGQLPKTVIERVRLPGNRFGRKPMPEHRKPLRKRAVDFTDAQIDQVLERWALSRSAFDLPFVAAAVGRDGKTRTG